MYIIFHCYYDIDVFWLLLLRCAIIQVQGAQWIPIKGILNNILGTNSYQLGIYQYIQKVA